MSLGPDARSLLDAASGADEPTDADAARVRAKLAARLTLAASASAGAAATTTTAKTAAAASLSLTSKVLIATAVVASTTTAAVVYSTSTASNEDRTEAPSLRIDASKKVSASATNASSPFAPPTPSGAQTLPLIAPTPTSTSTVVAEPTARAESVPSPAPPTRPVALPTGSSVRSTASRSLHAMPTAATSAGPPVAPVPDAPERATAPPPAPPPDTVTEEAAILRSAQSSLAHRDAPGALAKLDEHAQRFPHGALAEERQAARVFALCASGRPADARALATNFVAANPRSPLAAQVRSSCASLDQK